MSQASVSPAGSAGSGHNDDVFAALSRHWWLPLVRGLLLTVFGLLLLIEPLTAQLTSIEVMLAAFLALDALVAVALWWSNSASNGRRWWLVQAAVNLVFIALVAVWQQPSAVVVYYLVASWTLCLGVVKVVTSAWLSRERDLMASWVLVDGLVGVLFGLLLVARPQSEPVTGEFVFLTVPLGVYAFIVGSIGVVSSFAVRATAKEIDAALKGRSPVFEAIRTRNAAAEARRAAAAAQREQDKAAASAQKEREKAAASAQKERERAAEQARKDAGKQAVKERKEAEKAAAHGVKAAGAGQEGAATPSDIEIEFGDTREPRS